MKNAHKDQKGKQGGYAVNCFKNGQSLARDNCLTHCLRTRQCPRDLFCISNKQKWRKFGHYMVVAVSGSTLFKSKKQLGAGSLRSTYTVYCIVYTDS